MIKFESDTDGEGLTIIVDANGIEKLTFYLKWIKDNNDHVHLNIGHHLLDKPPVEGELNVKHVKIIYDENH